MNDELDPNKKLPILPATEPEQSPQRAMIDRLNAVKKESDSKIEAAHAQDSKNENLRAIIGLLGQAGKTHAQNSVKRDIGAADPIKMPEYKSLAGKEEKKKSSALDHLMKEYKLLQEESGAKHKAQNQAKLDNRYDDETSYKRQQDKEKLEYKKQQDKQNADLLRQKNEYQRLKDKQDRELKMKIASGKKSGKDVSEFEKALHKKQAADFADSEQSIQKTSTALAKVEDAINAQLDYTKNSIAGTGPLATLGGLTKHFSQDVEGLEAKFKEIDLKNMVSTFSGMSKAVDSDAERKAWKSTQAAISNDDTTNVQILLGSKSTLLKDREVAKAKSEFVRQNGNLDGFTNPILEGKVTSLVNPNGEMILVNKDQVSELKKQGFLDLDQETTRLLGGEVKAPADDFVILESPNGQRQKIKKSKAKKYIEKGAKVIQG